MPYDLADIYNPVGELDSNQKQLVCLNNNIALIGLNTFQIKSLFDEIMGDYEAIVEDLTTIN